MDPVVVSLVSAATALVVKASWKGPWERGRGAIEGDPVIRAKLERIVLVQWKIRLMLKPHEADHQELYLTIDAALKRLQDEQTSDAGTEGDIEKITALSQVILKREWVRVKRGE